MATIRFSVNTYAAIDLTHKLEKLSKSALPLAVRGTLNAAAFDVKKNTLQASARQNFIQRQPTFFKRFSSVNKAQGLSVNSMQSEVGMTNQGEEKALTPVTQLQQQEEGGVIQKGLDYLKGARGGNNSKRVARSQYFDKDKNLSGPFKNKGTSKSRYVAAAYASLKNKKRMSFKGKDGRRFTSQVTSIRKGKKGNITIKSRLLTVNREGHASKIRATHFSREAAMETVQKMPEFYKAEAEKQFRKYL